MWWCDMSGYILSILGIIIAGIFIDILMPNGQINKYIKSIYSVFVVAVLLNPLIYFFNNKNEIKFTYTNFEIDQELISYIHQEKIEEVEENIKKTLSNNGFKNIDVKINYSTDNNTLSYNSCSLNLSNLVMDEKVQHINKYEFIKDVVGSLTALTDEEIIIHE